MDIVAIYAAVVATAALLWNIARDIFHARRSVRLLLILGKSVYVGGQAVNAHVALRVANVSPNRQVEIVALELDSGLVWLKPDVDGGVKAATDEQELPVLLAPAQSIQIWLFLSRTTFERFAKLRRISVEDSGGRRYSVARRELRRVQREIVAIAGAQGSEQDFLKIITHDDR